MLALAAFGCFAASFGLHAAHAGDDHWWDQDGIMLLGLALLALHLAWCWSRHRRPPA